MHWSELVKWPQFTQGEPGYSALPSLCQKVESWEYLVTSIKDYHRHFYICICNFFIDDYFVNLMGGTT